jgi:hypothetical protein
MLWRSCGLWAVGYSVPPTKLQGERPKCSMVRGDGDMQTGAPSPSCSASRSQMYAAFAPRCGTQTAAQLASSKNALPNASVSTRTCRRVRLRHCTWKSTTCMRSHDCDGRSEGQQQTGAQSCTLHLAYVALGPSNRRRSCPSVWECAQLCGRYDSAYHLVTRLHGCATVFFWERHWQLLTCLCPNLAMRCPSSH